MSRLAIVRLMRVVLPLHRSFQRARCGAHKFVHALGALAEKERKKERKEIHFFFHARHMHAERIRGGGHSARALH